MPAKHPHSYYFTKLANVQNAENKLHELRAELNQKEKKLSSQRHQLEQELMNLVTGMIAYICIV